MAFTSAIPREWVYRPVTPDYGIDGLVEIFDSSSSATGGMFFVQLKGTDKPDLTSALRVSLKVRTALYYRTLLLPVLLVVFHAPSNSLFARFLPKIGQELKGARCSVQLTPADQWSVAIVEQAVEQLERVRSIGLREVLVAEYYETKRKIVWSDVASGPARLQGEPPRAGDTVSHYVFGIGVVESASDSYAFVNFNADGVTRKFVPADFHELFSLREA